MAGSNEASVEEILESIKKVIARDSRDVGANASTRKSTPAKSAQADEEEQVEDEVLDLSEMELSEVVEFDEDSGEDDSYEESASEEEEEDAPLLAENIRGAMQDNLAALAMLAEPGARPQIVRSGETSLEGLTRELLRPMLAEWLDKNLPGMVEKMVQAEIARIAGKRG